MGEEMRDFSDWLEKLEETATQAREGHEEDDWDTVVDRLAAVQANIDEILMRAMVLSDDGTVEPGSKRAITEVHIEDEGLRHAVSFGDLFSVHETDGHVLYLETGMEDFARMVDAEENPAVDILGEHYHEPEER